MLGKLLPSVVISGALALLALPACTATRSLVGWYSAETYEQADIALSRLMAKGEDMRHIGKLQATGPAASARSQLDDLASINAGRYCKDLAALNDMPRKAVNLSFTKAVDSAKDGNMAALVKTHLRMLRTGVPPSSSDVIRDFDALRFSPPSHSPAR